MGRGKHNSISKNPPYLFRKMRREDKTFKDIHDRVKAAREAREQMNKTLNHVSGVSQDTTTCYFCRKVIAKSKDNVYVSKRGPPLPAVPACTNCSVDGSRRHYYMRKYGMEQ